MSQPKPLRLHPDFSPLHSDVSAGDIVSSIRRHLCPDVSELLIYEPRVEFPGLHGMLVLFAGELRPQPTSMPRLRSRGQDCALRRGHGLQSHSRSPPGCTPTSLPCTQMPQSFRSVSCESECECECECEGGPQPLHGSQFIPCSSSQSLVAGSTAWLLFFLSFPFSPLLHLGVVVSVCLLPLRLTDQTRRPPGAPGSLTPEAPTVSSGYFRSDPCVPQRSCGSSTPLRPEGVAWRRRVEQRGARWAASRGSAGGEASPTWREERASARAST